MAAPFCIFGGQRRPGTVDPTHVEVAIALRRRLSARDVGSRVVTSPFPGRQSWRPDAVDAGRSHVGAALLGQQFDRRDVLTAHAVQGPAQVVIELCRVAVR